MKVIKLAQPGHDVKTAGDEDLIFNSNWPLLKIYQSGNFTANASGTTNYVVTNHNLGYPPVHFSFANNILANYLAIGSYGDLGRQTTLRSEFNGPIQVRPTVDSVSLYFNLPPSFVAPSQFYYYIFALDLETPYRAPSINLGKQPAGGRPSKVFKIAREGSDISSHHLEDYVIHSNTRTPLIHAVQPFTSVADNVLFPGGSGYVFHHDLGYPPMFMLYQKFTNPVVWSPTALTGLGSQADNQTITVYTGDAPGTQLSLVVLKDPFEIDYNVQVDFTL